MTDKFVRVRPEMTAADAIAFLRLIDPEIESFTDLYVLNPAQQLLGVVSLRAVITAPPDRRMSAIMNPHIVTVPPETDQEQVARLVARYDMLALPVVGEGRMLGIVTVDDDRRAGVRRHRGCLAFRRHRGWAGAGSAVL
jgi:magnesium transporter